MKYKFVLLLLFLIFFNSFIVYANSMEPPGLVVIVNNKVENINAYIIYDDKKIKGTKKIWINETQFWFMHNKNFNPSKKSKLYLKWENGEKTYRLYKLDKYHNTFTVNLNSDTLIKGKSLNRSIKLVSIRFLLTLILESIIFFLMGFRQIKTWKIFLVINMYTQLGLNIYINSLNVAISYPIFVLIFSEFWVFLIESISLTLLIKENKKVWRIFSVILANFFSLILGGYLITWLPI